jgi:uncharacterized protein
MRTAIGMTLLCLVLVPAARAATFDCNKASSFAEKVVCSDSRITAMDDELGGLYKEAFASSPNKDALKTEQKAWLASRDRCQDSNCIMKAYSDRIAALKGSGNATASVTGTYTMKGGEVRVQQTNDAKIEFFINATHQANVGEVSGEAPLSGDAASYADQDTDCALNFKFAGDKLVVSQDGSCGMGLNVSGSGTYKRTSTEAPKFDE